MHEAALYERSSFVTLTYSPENLPAMGTLIYSDFQKFMKRLRRAGYSARFYMCGEYGETTNRPHYHACLFGFWPPDAVYFRKSPSGERLYQSAILDKIWGLGGCMFGDVTFESAAYVARYCLKKVTGKAADKHYERVDTDTGEIYHLEPEFNQMSLKPGIGAGFFNKFTSDMYPRDYVVVRGTKCKPPKFYDRLFDKLDPDRMESIKADREARGLLNWEDNTVERLAVRERVAAARVQSNNRLKVE